MFFDKGSCKLQKRKKRTLKIAKVEGEKGGRLTMSDFQK
jgi:hypothetical protein